MCVAEQTYCEYEGNIVMLACVNFDSCFFFASGEVMFIIIALVYTETQCFNAAYPGH